METTAAQTCRLKVEGSVYLQLHRRSAAPVQIRVEQHPPRSPGAPIIAVATVRVSSDVPRCFCRGTLGTAAAGGSQLSHLPAFLQRIPARSLCPVPSSTETSLPYSQDFSQPCLGPAFWNSTAAVCVFRGEGLAGKRTAARLWSDGNSTILHLSAIVSEKCGFRGHPFKRLRLGGPHVAATTGSPPHSAPPLQNNRPCCFYDLSAPKSPLKSK